MDTIANKVRVAVEEHSGESCNCVEETLTVGEWRVWTKGGDVYVVTVRRGRVVGITGPAY